MSTENTVDEIPDFKFVGLLYQLCARMVTAVSANSSVTGNAGGGKFSSLLENLILKIGTNHPYHTLPIILALVNSNADENMEKPTHSVSFCKVFSDLTFCEKTANSYDFILKISRAFLIRLAADTLFVNKLEKMAGNSN